MTLFHFNSDFCSDPTAIEPQLHLKARQDPLSWYRNKRKRDRELNPVRMVVSTLFFGVHKTLFGKPRRQPIDGQGVARPYRRRQSAKHFTSKQSAKHLTNRSPTNISLRQPRRQIEYQRCTLGNRWAVWITEPAFNQIAGPRPLPLPSKANLSH